MWNFVINVFWHPTKAEWSKCAFVTFTVTHQWYCGRMTTCMIQVAMPYQFAGLRPSVWSWVTIHLLHCEASQRSVISGQSILLTSIHILAVFVFQVWNNHNTTLLISGACYHWFISIFKCTQAKWHIAPIIVLYFSFVGTNLFTYFICY